MQSTTNNTMQAFWVAIGTLSSFALGIVSVAILSRYFNKTEYGTYRQILYVYNTLLIIFSAGLPRVFAYFLPRYPVGQGKAIVVKISKMLFLCGFLFSVVLFFFSSFIAQVLKNPELEVGLKYFSPIPMLLLPTLGIEGIFSTYKRTVYIAIYNAITRLLMLLCIVLPVVLLHGTYLYAIYGWLVVSVISFAIAWYFKGIPFKNVKVENTALNYKEIFGYSIPLVLASLAGVAIKSADQFYISRFWGTEIFAEFANGFIELPFVAMITGATSTVLMPIFSKTFYEQGNVKQLIKTWNNALHKSAMIIYPLVIFFIVYGTEIMVLLYSEKYRISGVYFKINLVLNFFNIVVFAPLFFSMGKTRIYATVHAVLAVIVWFLDYVLINLFDNPIAIAINTTSLNIIKIIFFMYLASRLLNVRFFDFFPIKVLTKYLLHATSVVLITKFTMGYLLDFNSLFLEFIFSVLTYGLLLLITAPILRINYLAFFYPILEKFKK